MDRNNEYICPRVAVIGGGAAGMMAAVHAAMMGANVTLFEKNARLGRKLGITGKGRCNVTNDCTVQEFMQNVPTNPKFLFAALNRFSSADTVEFFESCGVPLKVERGKRVFPVSDRAADIVKALSDKCRECGVKIINDKVTALDVSQGAVRGVAAGAVAYEFDAVIVCTGGRSYQGTGSDGDGYRFARAAGHTVTELLPSLVPIVTEGNICQRMQGLSLKNVALRVVRRDSGKTVYEDFGEMMFTHFGITGPMVLSASAHIPDIVTGNYDAHVDLKPALDASALDARIRADFQKYSNKDFINSLDDLLPQKAIEPVIELSGIDPRKKVNSITKEERAKLLEVIKGLKIKLLRFRPIDEAIITKGGVSVSEINPKTMESKLVRGLYFAGEVIDLDAYTGGFNLQIAFSTAVVAGESAATNYL
ncbi:MAG: NAD(P)/FAD-dependent oxidoreductase [Ruminococcaceae bacterium]|nr:NAD(P)/FAD-dependent oxidoreductase [Oscillospiraceae bacterium]